MGPEIVEPQVARTSDPAQSALTASVLWEGKYGRGSRPPCDTARQDNQTRPLRCRREQRLPLSPLEGAGMSSHRSSGS
jgi:hypothetical protein